MPVIPGLGRWSQVDHWGWLTSQSIKLVSPRPMGDIVPKNTTHTKGLLRKDTQGRSLVSTQCLSMFSSYAHTHKSFSKALGDFRAQSCCFNQVSASWYRGLSPHSLLYFSTDVLLDTWGQALGDSAFGQCQMLPALPSSGHHSGWGRCQLRVSKLSNVLYYAADMYVCTWFLPAVWRSNASL